MLRGRRAERREERRDGDGRVHYRMRQRLVSIGDDYWIETDDGQRAYKVDGKALRLRKTLRFEDPGGRELARIQERVARVRDSMEIEDADGHRLAMVKKALISPLRDRWAVDVENGPDLEVHGNVLDHEYTFTDGGTTVATVSKKWFRVADSYGVEIAPDRDPVLVLAATVAVDMMAHEGK
ncbi:LURP-one-related/scramblase family protein [Blastococcus sp. URHD0036]|uniref:LURP-one-related/scramblase family protein n=1 Tax=Blastococcus sp. URHD0036 TaxID=1380356 RepID=UPI00049755BC|nr:LURP-one-related family protein [Blastococcus sp. URHD0036]